MHCNNSLKNNLLGASYVPDTVQGLAMYITVKKNKSLPSRSF
jgi:hypothetical protein